MLTFLCRVIHTCNGQCFLRLVYGQQALLRLCLMTRNYFRLHISSTISLHLVPLPVTVCQLILTGSIALICSAFSTYRTTSSMYRIAVVRSRRLLFRH